MRRLDRIIEIGIDHRSVSLDTLAAFHALRLEGGEAASLRDGEGCVALVTCHRLELYLENLPPCRVRGVFWTWLTGSPEPPKGFDLPLVIRRGEDAAEHLFTVAAGLESAVLGEDQILMQLRRAYRASCDGGQAAALLHRLFHTAFRVGKRVRSQTEVASGGRSLSGAAVATLQGLLGSLAQRRVLVLGLGEMGELAACRLRKRGVGELLLANRTHARAEKLAEALGARVLAWDWRATALSEVDAVVCATGAREAVISAKELIEASRGRSVPFVGVDLSVPRNLERPENPVEHLHLVDVEGLTQRLEAQSHQRKEAIAAARAIVHELLEDWASWVRSRGAHESGEARLVKDACRRRRRAAL